MTEPKQATSRQRSAFSDTVEILNELYSLVIPASDLIKAMDFTEEEFFHAHVCMTVAYHAKLTELLEEETK